MAEKIVKCWCRKCQDNTPHGEDQACIDCGTFFGERDLTDVGIAHSPQCACKTCWNAKNKEPKKYGIYVDFRAMVDRFCDQFKPLECYIYPKFAVMDFQYTAACERFCEYLEKGSADSYTGVHYDQGGLKVALIDVAEMEE